jgi:hypothetical protein
MTVLTFPTRGSTTLLKIFHPAFEFFDTNEPEITRVTFTTCLIFSAGWQATSVTVRIVRIASLGARNAIEPLITGTVRFANFSLTARF